eukprot:scaffold42141_cov30-Tisochrysis_lutea.AAC.2
MALMRHFRVVWVVPSAAVGGRECVWPPFAPCSTCHLADPPTDRLVALQIRYFARLKWRPMVLPLGCHNVCVH